MSFLRLTLGLQMASFFVTNLLKKCYLMIPISFSHQKHCQTTVLSLYVKCYLMMPISFSMSHDQKHCQTTVGIPLLPLICVTTLKICLSPIYFESFIAGSLKSGKPPLLDLDEHTTSTSNKRFLLGGTGELARLQSRPGVASQLILITIVTRSETPTMKIVSKLLRKS